MNQGNTLLSFLRIAQVQEWNLVTVGTTVGATVPATLEHTLCNALVDTGMTRICLSEEYYQQLLLPGLKPVHKLQVRTADQEVVSVPTGTITFDFKLGK